MPVTPMLLVTFRYVIGSFFFLGMFAGSMLLQQYAQLLPVAATDSSTNSFPQSHLDNPQSLPSENEFSSVSGTFRSRLPGLTSIAIVADDCIQHLIIDGEQAPAGLCAYPNAVRYRLPFSLTRQEVHIQTLVRNTGGGSVFYVFPAPSSLNMIALDVIQYLSLLGFVLLLSGWLAGRFWSIPLAIILAIAIFQRSFYSNYLPYGYRDYDTIGHLQYMQYLLQEASIPPAQEGWQYYHPPGFHILSLAVWKGMEALYGGEVPAFGRVLQNLALLLSCCCLILLTWVGRLLFQHKEMPASSFLLSMTLASTFPGLAVLSSRANNDGILTLFALFILACALWLWQSADRLPSLLGFFAAALALLVKSSALVFCCAFGFLHLFVARLRFLAKCKRIFIGFMLIALLYGPYAYTRFIEQGERHLVGNQAANHPDMFTDTDDVWSFIWFNPASIMQHPYPSAYSGDERRRFVWEYYLRTGLFGEFQAPSEVQWLTHVLLFHAQFLIPLLIWGVILGFRRPWNDSVWPAFVFLMAVIASQIALRVDTPIPALADFRYTAWATPLYAYFIVCAASSFRRPVLRAVSQFAIISVSALSVFWMVAIALLSKDYGILVYGFSLLK